MSTQSLGDTFLLPDLGEGLAEAEIVRWLVAEGDPVSLNQPLVEVETAKAVVEIPSPHEGRVEKLLAGESQTVDVGAPIVRFATSSPVAGATDPDDDAPQVLVGYGPRPPQKQGRPRPGRRDHPGAPAAGDSPRAKPPVRKLARDLDVDLTTVQGSGPEGQILRDDVRAAARRPSLTPERQDDRAAAAAAAMPARPETRPNGDRRTRADSVRRATAKSMVASAFSAPHASATLEVDITGSLALLDRLAGAGEKVKPFAVLCSAIVRACRRYPLLNGLWDADSEEIVVRDYVNLGIAAATDRGLVVVAVPDAHTKGLAGLAGAIDEAVAKAREGRATPQDLTGATITVSNVGVFGVDGGTAIIPPGQSALVCAGAIRRRPWIHEDGQSVVVRPLLNMSVSFDHRLIDGEQAAMFLRDVGRLLAAPETAILLP